MLFFPHHLTWLRTKTKFLHNPNHSFFFLYPDSIDKNTHHKDQCKKKGKKKNVRVCIYLSYHIRIFRRFLNITSKQKKKIPFANTHRKKSVTECVVCVRSCECMCSLAGDLFVYFFSYFYIFSP